MAMDRNPRRLRLVVTEIEVELNTGQGEDFVEIVYAGGKVLPSTEARINDAIRQENWTAKQRTMA